MTSGGRGLGFSLSVRRAYWHSTVESASVSVPDYSGSPLALSGASSGRRRAGNSASLQAGMRGRAARAPIPVPCPRIAPQDPARRSPASERSSCSPRCGCPGTRSDPAGPARHVQGPRPGRREPDASPRNRRRLRPGLLGHALRPRRRDPGGGHRQGLDGARRRRRRARRDQRRRARAGAVARRLGARPDGRHRRCARGRPRSARSPWRSSATTSSRRPAATRPRSSARTS